MGPLQPLAVPVPHLHVGAAFLWQKPKLNAASADTEARPKKFGSFVQNHKKALGVFGLTTVFALVNFAPIFSQTKAGCIKSFGEISGNQLPKFIPEVFGSVGVATALMIAWEIGGQFWSKVGRVRLFALAALSAIGWHAGKLLAPALYNPPKTLIQAIEHPVSGLAKDLQALWKRLRIP